MSIIPLFVGFRAEFLIIGFSRLACDGHFLLCVLLLPADLPGVALVWIDQRKWKRGCLGGAQRRQREITKGGRRARMAGQPNGAPL